MTIPNFIDTHHHFWDLGNNSYPWLDDGIDHFVGDYEKIRKELFDFGFFKFSGGFTY